MIYAKGRVGQDVLFVDETNTKTIYTETDFYKNLDPKAQKLLDQIILAFTDEEDVRVVLEKIRVKENVAFAIESVRKNTQRN